MKSYADLLREARAEVPEITPLEADVRREADPRTVLIDVREDSEWEAGHVTGAVHVGKSYIEQDIEGVVPERDRPVVLYCAGGIRSLFAGQTLRGMGYTNVVSMSGGFQQWKAQGLGWDVPRVLTDAQKQRYSRHLLIPEVGSEGQGRLIDSKVLLIGAGGLGSPAALYLAAAGVGTLGIVDFDVVDVSNLQRQILHTTDRVGERKVESARKSIQALNPETKVVAHEEMLTTDNVERIIAGYDVILDGTDTFETRYALNDAAVAAGIPVVHASVFRFEGQLTVLKPFDGPCYRCLYPTPPPPELAPGCSVAGVLGVVPGIMGMLQANEVLKLLLGIGEPLVGRLLLFDALETSFTELRLKRDPACPVCSDAAVEARREGRALPLPAGTGPVADQPFVLGGTFGGAA
ncbi:MAG TPA: molybdopterin-synthase adenylyltransferase MoeB [Candidatus Dormibacteraeota bacterium]|nr:molybdopterin-synthase adenylyltransferase MoeB [Candidatus Dormibacteraeota bacterium]